MRLGFFTAGTVGAGHLARGLALARAFARDGAGLRVDYAIFGPRTPFRVGRGAGAGASRKVSVHEVTIDHEELRDPSRARASQLANALRDYAPDVLVVDLFWAPLRHILPLPSCEAWLLVRSVPEIWFTGPAGHPYERTQFTRVIAIEPGAGRGHEDETIDPIVIANPEEARPSGALREALGVAPEEKLVVVHQAGMPGEWATLAREGREGPERASVHAFTLSRDDASPAIAPPSPPLASGVHIHDGDSFFPLAEWLPGADAIASGAGYNSFWEAHWMGYAKRTTFAPFARQLDDQAWRVRTCASHVPRANGADILARRLR